MWSKIFQKKPRVLSNYRHVYERRQHVELNNSAATVDNIDCGETMFVIMSITAVTKEPIYFKVSVLSHVFHLYIIYGYIMETFACISGENVKRTHAPFPLLTIHT